MYLWLPLGHRLSVSSWLDSPEAIFSTRSFRHNGVWMIVHCRSHSMLRDIIHKRRATSLSSVCINLSFGSMYSFSLVHDTHLIKPQLKCHCFYWFPLVEFTSPGWRYGHAGQNIQMFPEFNTPLTVKIACFTLQYSFLRLSRHIWLKKNKQYYLGLIFVLLSDIHSHFFTWGPAL